MYFKVFLEVQKKIHQKNNMMFLTKKLKKTKNIEKTNRFYSEPFSRVGD